MNKLQETTQRALITFCALSKVQNQQYTHFLGMFKHAEKQKFNDLIRASESFVKTINANLDEQSLKAVEDMENYLHDMIFSLVEGKEFITKN
jgi:lipopolysaccharide biosynthesis regulator YciM